MIQLRQQVELCQKFSIFLSCDFVFEHFDGPLLFGALAKCPVDLAVAALPDGLLEMVVVGCAVVDHLNETGYVYLQFAEDAAAVDVVGVYLLAFDCFFAGYVVDLFFKQVHNHAVSSQTRS